MTAVSSTPSQRSRVVLKVAFRSFLRQVSWVWIWSVLWFAAANADAQPHDAGPTTDDASGAVPAQLGAVSETPEAVAETAAAPSETSGAASQSPETAEGIQEGTEEEPEQGVAPQPAGEHWPLAGATKDGRRFRLIALYTSQLVELVPDHFRPVELERLAAALTQWGNPTAGDAATELVSASYDIRLRDETLVCDRSTLRIESESTAVVRHRLGRVNLALTPPARTSHESAGSLPRLESDGQGNLIAVTQGSGPITFRWSLRGVSRGHYQDFVLQIPRAAQTTLNVEVPADVTLEVLDGVLRGGGTNSDGRETVRPRGASNRYVIDAGGLATVRLRTRLRASDDEQETVLVRRSLSQYDIDPSGVSWVARMAVQTSGGATLPPLLVRDGTVASIEVDSTDVPFVTAVVDARTRRVQLELPGQADGFGGSPIALTIAGRSTWQNEDGWCPLAELRWETARVIPAAATAQIQLRVFDPLQVVAWDLPRRWTQGTESRLSDTATILQAEGPLLRENESAAWSHVRLVRRPVLRTCETTLKLAVGEESLAASAQIELAVDPDRLEPVRLQLERGWTLSSLVLPASGRVLEAPNVDEVTNTVLLWPEPDDVEDSVLVIEAVGRSRVTRAGNSVRLPPTWFVRVDGVVGSYVAVVEPPPQLKWSGETTMRGRRIPLSELSEFQRSFVGTTSADTLVFRPASGRTPALQLQPPSIAFNVATSLRLFRRDGNVHESFVIETDSLPQMLNEVRISTGPAAGRPNYRWSLRSGDDSAPISLPLSAVTLDDPDGAGNHTIDLAGRDLRGKRLIGRREYPLQETFSIQLPSIPEAASQDAEVLIGEGLLLRQAPDSVLRVPLDESSDDDASVQITSLSPDGTLQPLTRLRYDAVDQPRVVIGASDTNPGVTMVWSEDVRVVASSYGSDSIDARYEVRSEQPIRISYPPALRLAAVFRNDQPVDLSKVSRRPLELPGSDVPRESVRVLWNREGAASRVFRYCPIPKLQIDGVVVRSRYQVLPSPDTFAPAELWFGAAPRVADRKPETPNLNVLSRGESRSTGGFPAAAGGTVILMQRNVLLAAGWLVAMGVFSLSWWLARHSLLVVACGALLMGVSLLFWTPWAAAIISWFILPTITAGLLVASTRRSRSGWLSDTGDGGTGRSAAMLSGMSRSTEPARADPSASAASWSAVQATKSLLLALAVAWASTPLAEAQAQPPEMPDESDQPINVLRPVDANGNPQGDKVYIPETVHDDLFRRRGVQRPATATFLAAEYQVKVDYRNELSETDTELVEADYLIHVDRESARVRLPIEAVLIRRVELVQPDADRIVQFIPDGVGGTVVSVPPSHRLRLRVTMAPQRSREGTTVRLRLKVPPIASSYLTVDAERGIENVQINRSLGEIQADDDLRLWIAEIGPIGVLDVSYQLATQRPAVEPAPLQRRYWVHVGVDETVVDCELTPPSNTAVGESLQVTLLDAEMPILTSRAWRLQRHQLLSPGRTMLTFARVMESAEPIRLIWTRETLINPPPSGDEPLPMALPEIVASPSREVSPAWIAIDHDPNLRVMPVASEATEPLAVEQFLSVWSGYRGHIDRALVAVNLLPSLVVRETTSLPASLTQQHHVHVTADELQIRYSAKLKLGEAIFARRSLRLPSGIELLSLRVNGELVSGQPVQSGSFREIPLGRLPSREQVTIEAVATESIRPGQSFSLPELTVLPAIPMEGSYTLSRDQATQIHTLQSPAIGPDPVDGFGAEALVHGWIPVATWSYAGDSNLADSPLRQARFAASERPTRFASSQLISLSWDEGRWSMTTTLKIASSQLPDFIDIEIPTRWCENLEVQPAASWSRQPATDPARQIVRVRCDAAAAGEETLTIRGQLKPADKGRISVPAVKVLGAGRRRVYVSVPERLTNERVQWRTSSVAAVDLPPVWANHLSPNTRRSTYAVAGGAWSVELASLPRVSFDPVATAQDLQLFPGEQKTLLMCRWDLLPGGLDSVVIQIPESSECRGVWTAGRAVLPESLASQTDLIRVPLSLSRLSQSVEVLIQLPESTTKSTARLPRLLDIPVHRQWVATYAPDDPKLKLVTEIARRGSPEGLTKLHAGPVTTTSGPAARGPADTETGDLTQERRLALAASILTSVEGSLDLLAERAGSEVASWLEPWVIRYQLLARSAGHPVDWQAFSAEELASSPEPSTSRSAGSTSEQWHEFHRRMAVQVTRFLSPDWTATRRVVDRMDLSDYTLVRVHRVSPAEDSFVVPRLSRGIGELRSFLVAMLGMVTAVGVLGMLWPARKRAAPMLNHPSFWLALVGLCGLLVAPAPFATALLVVACLFLVLPGARV